MMKWLLRAWHRFVLGRTATEVPSLMRHRASPGSSGYLVSALWLAAQGAVSQGTSVTVCMRPATDLPPRKIRIVIEGA